MIPEHFQLNSDHCAIILIFRNVVYLLFILNSVALMSFKDLENCFMFANEKITLLIYVIEH